MLEYSPLPAPEFMKPILETPVEDVRDRSSSACSASGSHEPDDIADLLWRRHTECDVFQVRSASTGYRR